MGFFDTLAMVPLGVGEAEKTLLQKIAELVNFRQVRVMGGSPTPFHSKTQKQYSAGHEYQTPLRFHLRPI